MRSYYKVNLKFPRDNNLDEKIDEALMTFYDSESEGFKDSVRGEFGDVQAPFFSEFNEAIEQVISNIVKTYKQDVLIAIQHTNDEDGDFFNYYIYKNSGEIIEGTDFHENYGCSFEYSDQEEEDEDDDFDILDMYDEDYMEETKRKCVIELYQFCIQNGLKITEKEVDFLIGI